MYLWRSPGSSAGLCQRLSEMTPDGIGPEVIRFFQEVIDEPLDQMADRITAMEVRLSAVLAEHDASRAARAEHRRKAWLAVKWIGGAVVTVAGAVIAARGGL